MTIQNRSADETTTLMDALAAICCRVVQEAGSNKRKASQRCRDYAIAAQLIARAIADTTPS